MAAHLAVFAWIGLRTPLSDMRPIAPETIEVFLLPPPQPPQPRADRGARPPSAPAVYRPRVVTAIAPSNVEPIPAPSGPPAPPGRTREPATLPAPWDGLKQALRASPVGCAHRERLTPAERDDCNQKLGAAGGGRMLPLGIAPEKLARFDAAAAAKAKDRAIKEGQMTQPMVACTGRASNFGIGCNPGQ